MDLEKMIQVLKQHGGPIWDSAARSVIVSAVLLGIMAALFSVGAYVAWRKRFLKDDEVFIRWLIVGGLLFLAVLGGFFFVDHVIAFDYHVFKCLFGKQM